MLCEMCMLHQATVKSCTSVEQSLLDSDEAVPEIDAQGQDEVTMKRMKMAFRALGVAMVPLTASMPQVRDHRNTVTAMSKYLHRAARLMSSGSETFTLSLAQKAWVHGYQQRGLQCFDADLYHFIMQMHCLPSLCGCIGKKQGFVAQVPKQALPAMPDM